MVCQAPGLAQVVFTGYIPLHLHVICPSRKLLWLPSAGGSILCSCRTLSTVTFSSICVSPATSAGPDRICCLTVGGVGQLLPILSVFDTPVNGAVCLKQLTLQDSKLIEPFWFFSMSFPGNHDLLKEILLNLSCQLWQWNSSPQQLGESNVIVLGEGEECRQMGSSCFHHLCTPPRPNIILSYQDSDPCPLHTVSGKIKKDQLITACLTIQV